MTEYKAAVIGLGRMGSTFDDEMESGGTLFKPYCHGPTYYYSDRVELVGGADLHDGQRAIFGERWGLSSDHMYSDYREMIEKEKPDIVSVTTPSWARAEPIIFCAEHGVRGIYSEKGLCASLEEADRIAESCQKNNVAFNWGAMRRHHDGYIRMAEAIAQLEAAQASGLSITACTYPYTFWATSAGNARFENFREKYGISYGDLQVAGTDERLTEETFRAARAARLLTAAFAMSDDDIDTSLTAPWVMIGSDAILERPHNNHPRSTGCFSRVLGHYVRERGLLTLPEALAKMTILPARLLGGISPAMARRGRIQSGAVADITVFDPETVIDRSTYEDATIPAEGIPYVIIAGEVVVDGGEVTDARPGRAVRARLR